MSQHLPIRYALLTLLCVALLLARVGGAHLHLCFDGAEPAATVHLFESEVHHVEAGIGAPHQDEDVSLVADLIGKLSKSGVDTALWLLAALLCWLALPTRRTWCATTRADRLDARLEFLLPPLRGPPLLTSL